MLPSLPVSEIPNFVTRWPLAGVLAAESDCYVMRSCQSDYRIAIFEPGVLCWRDEISPMLRSWSLPHLT